MNKRLVLRKKYRDQKNEYFFDELILLFDFLKTQVVGSPAILAILQKMGFFQKLFVNFLPFIFPLHASYLNDYLRRLESVQLAVKTFSVEGWLDEDHLKNCFSFLTNSLGGYVDFKSKLLLSLARKTIIENPYEPFDLFLPFDKIVNFGVHIFHLETLKLSPVVPEIFCSIGTQNIKFFILLIHDALLDAVELEKIESGLSNSFLILIRDILYSFFCFIEQYHVASFHSAPQLAVLYAADCEYLAQFLICFQANFSFMFGCYFCCFLFRFPASFVVCDFVIQLRISSRVQFHAHLQRVCTLLEAVKLEVRDLFNTFETSSISLLTTAIKNTLSKRSVSSKSTLISIIRPVIADLRSLAKSWSILPSGLLNSIFRAFFAFFLESCVEGVLKMENISIEAASSISASFEEIVKLLTVSFDQKLGIFDQWIVYERFLFVSTLLGREQTLLGISRMCRAGMHKSLTDIELKSLVCALFVDSQARKDCIDLISKS